MHLGEVDGHEAADLMRNGAAVRRCKGARVREIEIPERPGPPIGPASKPRLTQYMGQKYTRREPVNEGASHLVQFRRIHPDDQALFMLSVTDCGGKLIQKRG